METVANLRLLQPRTRTDEAAAQVDSALSYLQSRLQMLDYPHFRRRDYPIGSGSVESGHKVVVQQRLKCAGIRWAEHHVDPMLALRNLVCNKRWDEGWQQIILFQQEQQVVKRLRRAEAKQPPPSEPITLASLKAAGLLPDDEATEKPPASAPRSKRPARTIPGGRVSGQRGRPGAGISSISKLDAHP